MILLNMLKKKNYSVYLLLCSDSTLYCGITNNLPKRLLAHNSPKGGAKYTRSRQPVTLLLSIPCATKSEALKLEHRIKRMSRKQKLKLIQEYQDKP